MLEAPCTSQVKSRHTLDPVIICAQYTRSSTYLTRRVFTHVNPLRGGVSDRAGDAQLTNNEIVAVGCCIRCVTAVITERWSRDRTLAAPENYRTLVTPESV